MMFFSNQKEKKQNALKNTSDFNTMLNQWKNKFIDSIIKDVTSGLGDEDGISGGGLKIAVLGSNKSKNTKQDAISIALSSYFGVGGVKFRMENKVGEYVDTVAFGAYKRNVFTKIGSLDEELIKNQDLDYINFLEKD